MHGRIQDTPFVVNAAIYAEMSGLAWERIHEAYEGGHIETFEEAIAKFDEWKQATLALGYVGIKNV